MTIFFAVLIWKKAPAAIGAMLDKQIAEIAQQLNEAEQLRLDAASLNAEYEAKLADAAKEADDLPARAAAAAAAPDAKAKADPPAMPRPPQHTHEPRPPPRADTSLGGET